MSAGNSGLAISEGEQIEWEGGSLNFFKTYDGPYIHEDVELGNHALRKILQKHFEYMSRNLFYISAFGRYLLGSTKETEIVMAEDIAMKTLTNAIESIGKRIKQAELLIKEAGIEDIAMYGKKKKVKLPVTSQGAMVYASLLVQTDHFYSLNSLLWFRGEIDSKNKFANESEARKEIQGVVRGVSNQFLFILKKTREKDKKFAEKAGVHNEEKMADGAQRIIDAELDGSMTGHVMDSGAPATEKVLPTDPPKSTRQSKSNSSADKSVQTPT